MKKLALVIGHKKSSPGAQNKLQGINEFLFNEQLSLDIEKCVSDVIVQRVYRRTYQSLPDDINEFSPDFIISLHSNAYNGSVSGTEVLYYHRSTNGKMIANILNNKLVSALDLKNRGIKPKSSEDRGGYLLKNTRAPCVIAEPFFIDNDKDLQVATVKRPELVNAYAESITMIANQL